MVIDTSALVAMLSDEPEADVFEAAVEADGTRLMSTASYVETAIVIEARFGEPGGRELDLWLHRAAVDLVAVDADQADVARIAYRTYGKGRHRAASTTAIASPMPWPRSATSLCCSKATISRRPISAGPEGTTRGGPTNSSKG